MKEGKYIREEVNKGDQKETCWPGAQPSHTFFFLKLVVNPKYQLKGMNNAIPLVDLRNFILILLTSQCEQKEYSINLACYILSR